MRKIIRTVRESWKNFWVFVILSPIRFCNWLIRLQVDITFIPNTRKKV